MIDLPTGRVAYAVLSFGGLLGMGDKHEVVLDASKERLQNAQAFKRDH